MYSNKCNLTFPETNIYLVEKFNDITPINTIAGLLKIDKDFDEKICIEIINKLIKNNDALRIKIHEENNSVYQTIDDYIYNDIEYIDMSNKSGNEIEKYYNDFVSIPFYFNDGNLYEFKILRYNSNSGGILLKAHHIISDAWTLRQIINQLISMYNNCLNNKQEENVVPSYIDFIESEKKYISSEKYIKDKQFWNEYLKKLNQPLSLKNTTSKISNKANRYSIILDKDINNKILEYTKTNKVSVYSLFLAALSTYIYRIKNENDFVIGTPILNRSNFKEKQMLGMFISTMPIRMQIEENINFLDLIKKISLDTKTLFRHQKYPITKMLEQVHSTTDIKGKIYNVMLSYQNARSNISIDSNYSTQWLFSGYIQDELEIHIMDMDNDGVLNIHYDYLVDLFDSIEIEYLHTRLMAIIQNAIENPNVDIENINIMSLEEKNKILYEFNDTKTEYPKDKTVIELFEEQVEKNPNNIALVFENRELTYKQLNEKANQLACYLKKEKTVNNSDSIAIIFDKGIEQIISIIAILKLGLAYLPIEKDTYANKIKYMLNTANAKLILTNLNINLDDVKIINFNQCETEINNIKISKIHPILNNNIVYIMYTSGTTGEPKGVIVKNKNVIRLVKNTNYIKFEAKDRMIQTGSNAFDASTFEYFGSLLNGLTLFLLSKEDLIDYKKLKSFVIEKKITIMWLTSSLFNQMVEINPLLFHNLRVLLVGGERLSTNHINILIDTCPKLKIINGYGPTENTTFSTFFNIDKKYYDKIPIGSPIANSKAYIVDKNVKLLPIGVEGELLVSGDGVAAGYLNNKKLTEEKFIDGPFNIKEKSYKTGDVCMWLEDGMIDYLGRKDNQIKIHGFRIELDAIKSIILNLKYIKNCQLLVDKDKNNRKIILAFIILNEKISLTKIKIELSKVLTKYMMPSKFIEIKNMPLNKNGKIDTKSLLKYAQEIKLENSLENEELSEYEKTVYDVYCNILDKKYVSKDESFFYMGGDSILAIKLAMLLSKKFNKEVSVKDIFENDTIIKMSDYLTNAKCIKNFAVPLKQEYYPLSNGQNGMLSQFFLNPISLYYNIPFEICIPDLKVKNKIKSAIEKVVMSNSSLFTKIIKINNKFFQKIELPKNYKINEYYTSNEEYNNFKKNNIKIFNLLEDYLFDINIYITETNVNVLFNFHHIIFDGTSLKLFIDNIKNAYLGYDIIKENINMGQIVLLNKKNSNNSDSKKYYLEKFAGDIPDTKINYDLKKCNKIYVGKQYKNLLEFKILEKAKKFSESKNITMNTLLFGVFNIVISKYTFSEDIILGTAYAGRNRNIEKNLIGMFVKVLPIRTKVKKDYDIDYYLNRVKKDLIDSIAYSDYSFEELVKDLKINPQPNSNPIFNIMFIYQNMGISDLSCINKDITFQEIDTDTSKMDLIFEIMPFEDDLKVKIEYNSNLYDEKIIENIFIHFKNVLKEIIFENNNMKLSDIEMLTLKEKNELLLDYNKKNVLEKQESSIIALFKKNVINTPDVIAVETSDNKLTYKELDEKSDIVANYLISINIKIEDRIGILMNRTCDLPVVILGIIKAGGCYVPIDNEYPDSRKESIIKNGNIKTVICDSNIDKKINNVNYIKVKNILLDNNKNSLPYVNIDKNNLLYIIFTSGTTGNPKPVMIEHKSVLNYISSVKRNMNYNIENKILSITTICFDIFVFEFFPTICLGKTLVLASNEEQKDPKKIVQLIYNKKVDKIMTTPSRIQLILDAAKEINMLKTINEINLGGEPFPTNLIEIIKSKIKCDIFNCYGPTETTVYSTFKNLSKVDNVTIGEPINNTQIYILDKFDRLAPNNQIGQIAIGGLGVSRGYYNQSKLTSEKFIRNIYNNNIIYKTGDIGKWINSKNLICLGRIDNQVKLRGFRIELDEISQRVNQLNFIKSAIAVIKILNNNKYLVLYYTVKEDSNVDFQNIILNHLKKTLPNYMVPSYFIKLKKIPLTINGKIDKKKLPDVKYKSSNFKNENLTILQIKLLSIFKEVLNIENISINDNFFEIGGDSILAMKIVLLANNKNINIEYPMVFKYQTINKLSEGIKNYKYKDTITEKVKELNFDNINKVLKNQKNYGYISKSPKNILLIGSTGFLGIHILDYYLKTTDCIIYCIVRDKNKIHPVDRLKQKLNFYFKSKYNTQIGKRIIVINADILEEDIFKIKSISTVINKIDLVINSAADVRHFGDLEQFYKINVEIVNRLIELCVKYNKELLHISTTSVSGDFLSSKNDKIIKKYDENSLYIGQNLENNYVYTKFLAEYNILNSIYNKGLKAKIMRMGNLMGRSNDGKFQENVNENAFLMRIKAILKLKVMPKNLLDTFVEFTPIDDSAKAVVDLYHLSMDQIIYHIVDKKYIKVKDIVKYIYNKYNIHVDCVDNKKFVKKVMDISNKNIDKSYIYEIILDIERNSDLDYTSNIIVDTDLTELKLKDVSFNWTNIDIDYLDKFFNYIMEVGYFKEDTLNE